MKYLGVRSARPIPLGAGTRIAVRSHWSEQPNTSYLTGAVVLSPHATDRNPLDTADWLRIAYVGVPPRRDARLLVSLRATSRQRTVYTDGWPEANPGGRAVGAQEVIVCVRDRTLEVREADRQVWRAQPDEVTFGEAYLYLQLSSHSNYPARSIDFDGVRIDRQGCEGTPSGGR